MTRGLQATPYTPIFPPHLPGPLYPSSPSSSCDSVVSTSDGLKQRVQKPYVEGLKERYLLLASLPHELCPPSRETSPEADSRIEVLTSRMRKAHKLRFPLELTLVCCGVKGGDWTGEPLLDQDQNQRVYCLPDTEQEWFEWERKGKEAKEKLVAEKVATEYRKRIAKWSEEIQEGTFMNEHFGLSLSQPPERSNTLDHTIVKSAVSDRGKEERITSRYFSPRLPTPFELNRELSDPVERASSPIPPDPALDPLPDFCDSFSLPDSPPVLPDNVAQDLPIPDDINSSLSFAIQDKDISTPKRERALTPVLQLSSPVSPPRSVHLLTVSQTSSFPTFSKRPLENDYASGQGANHGPMTPRVVKRARTTVEPITPKSVVRPSVSQEPRNSQDPKQLPTLDALLAASSRKVPSRKGTPLDKELDKSLISVSSGSPSPHRVALSAAPEPSHSQPNYSTFFPQFQSTQYRAMSLPLSPSQPRTATQPSSPQKAFGGTGSSGIGFFQSQFNVESRVDKVAAFLDKDVWEFES